MNQAYPTSELSLFIKSVNLLHEDYILNKQNYTKYRNGFAVYLQNVYKYSYTVTNHISSLIGLGIDSETVNYDVISVYITKIMYRRFQILNS